MTQPNKLDASGGSVFRIIIGPAMLDWIRAAASTPRSAVILKWFMQRGTGIVTLCLILFGVFSVPGAAQDDQKVFASVPDAVRARLIDRFRLLVIYETSAQWDREYDLLESRYASGKEEYVAKRRRSSPNPATKWIFAFIAEKTEDVSSSDLQADYKVVGYANVEERGCLVKRKGFVYAFLRNGDWYFSGFAVELPTSHAPPAPCVS